MIVLPFMVDGQVYDTTRTQTIVGGIDTTIIGTNLYLKPGHYYQFEDEKRFTLPSKISPEFSGTLMNGELPMSYFTLLNKNFPNPILTVDKEGNITYLPKAFCDCRRCKEWQGYKYLVNKKL